MRISGLKKSPILLIVGLLVYFLLNSNSFGQSLNPAPSPSPSVVLQPSANVLGAQTLAKVVKVVDGDTIEVEINAEKKKVRLIGVNTPETVDPRRGVQCFGKEASDEMKSILSEKSVLLEKDVSEVDKYDRLLRYVYLPQSDGSSLFVNDYLVRAGFAQVSTYPPDVKYQAQFIEAQKVAKDGNLGLWSKCNAK